MQAREEHTLNIPLRARPHTHTHTHLFARMGHETVTPYRDQYATWERGGAHEVVVEEGGGSRGEKERGEGAKRQRESQRRRPTVSGRHDQY